MGGYAVKQLLMQVVAMAAAVFQPKSVDAVIGQFVKAVDALEQVNDTQNAKAQAKADEVERLCREVDNHRDEARRAYAVANKIRNLVY